MMNEQQQKKKMEEAERIQAEFEREATEGKGSVSPEMAEEMRRRRSDLEEGPIQTEQQSAASGGYSDRQAIAQQFAPGEQEVGYQETSETRIAREIQEGRRMSGQGQGDVPSTSYAQGRGFSSEDELRLRDQTLSRTAPATDQPVKRVSYVMAPAVGGMVAATGMSQERQASRTSSEDMIGSPAGTGSYYSESRERPYGSASPQGSYGGGSGQFSEAAQGGQRKAMAGEGFRPSDAPAPREIPPSRPAAAAQMSGARAAHVPSTSPEEMVLRGEAGHPPAGQSYSKEGWSKAYGQEPTRPSPPEKPMDRSAGMAAPVGTMAAGAMMAEQKMQQAPAEQPRPYITTPTQPSPPKPDMGSKTTPSQPTISQRASGMGAKIGTAMAPVTSKVSEVGHQISPKVEGVKDKVMGPPSEPGKPRAAEDTAHNAGKTIGHGLKKAADVIKGFGMGLDKGIRGDQAASKGGQMAPAPGTPAQPMRQPEVHETQVVPENPAPTMKKKEIQ
jgi:hypothetical protein